MRRFLSYETGSRELKDGLKAFLQGMGIYTEISGVDSYGWHFSILCNDAEIATVNSWLEVNV